MNTQIQLRGKEFDGTDYVYVYGDGTPIQNGNELRAAVATAYADYAVTNRIQTVLIGPGKYNMNFQPLELTNEIKLVGLSSNKDDVEIISAPSTNYPGLIGDVNFDVPNQFNDVYTSLTALNYSFDTVNRATNNFLIGSNPGGLVKLSTQDGTYVTYPYPSGYNSGSLYVDKNTEDIYYYAYSYSLSTNFLTKLTSNMTIDPSFSPIAISNGILSVASDINTGGVFVAGYFNNINGYSRNRIAKINSDGTLDLTFDPGVGFNSNIEALCFDNYSNKLLVGGFFNNYNGNSAKFFAALDGTTAAYSPLTGQTASFNGPVLSIYLDIANVKLIFSGQFSSYNSTSFNRAVKTDLDGSNPVNLFLSSTSGATRLYSNFIFGQDGYIYAIGQNADYNGTVYAYNSILKIDLSGNLIDVIAITPQLPGFSNNLFFSFTDQGGQVFNLMPYYVNASNFASINVNTPFFFFQVYLTNLKVTGSLINNTRLNISNVYLTTYIDIDYYNQSLYISSGYWLDARDNSNIQNTYTSSGDFRLDSSYLNMSEVNTNLQSSGYYNFQLNNGSRLTNALNGSQRCNVGSVMCYDSNIFNSFNGFNNTTYLQSNNKASTANQLEVKKSRIESCFNDTVLTYINVDNCSMTYSLNVNGSAANNQANYYYSLNISDSYLQDSLVFNTGKYGSSFPDSIGEIRVNGVDCTGNCLYFDTVLQQLPYTVSFSNVNLLRFNNNSLSLKLRLVDAPYPGAYNWYGGATFNNCSIANPDTYNLDNVDVMSIIIDSSLTTPANMSELSLQNISFNNCHVRTNGSLKNALNISVTDDKRGILISSTEYVDCSVSTRLGVSNGSFISNLSSLAFINVNNSQFNNCIVSSPQGPNPAFLSNISSTGGYTVQLNFLKFLDCHSNSSSCFIGNITCADFYFDATTFDNCTAGNDSFVSLINTPSLTQPGPINFRNCTAGDNSFVSQGMSFFVSTPYTPTFNYINCSARSNSFNRTFMVYTITEFKHCSAGENSFGNSYFTSSFYELNITGKISNCVCGTGSLGTQNAMFGTIVCSGPTYINNCTTDGSILNLSGYTGSYNS